MRHLLANTFQRVATWLRPKAMPQSLTGQQWTGTQFLDAYKRNRQPTPNEIMAELKNTAWACASINAAVCASNPPQLYVATHDGQHSPKCPTKALSPRDEKRLRTDKRVPLRYRKVPAQGATTRRVER